MSESKSHALIRRAYKNGYRVTDDGRVMGLRGRAIGTKLRGRYLVFCFQCGLDLSRSGQHSIPVHRFAAYCFFGEMMFEPGIVVRHLNDDPQDFSKDNIALGTAKDNTHDIPPEVRARTARIASEAARNKKCRTGAKLNESDVREIRARLALGESVKSIAKSYGVGGRCIRYIRAKRTWADVA